MQWAERMDGPSRSVDSYLVIRRRSRRPNVPSRHRPAAKFPHRPVVEPLNQTASVYSPGRRCGTRKLVRSTAIGSPFRPSRPTKRSRASVRRSTPGSAAVRTRYTSSGARNSLAPSPKVTAARWPGAPTRTLSLGATLASADRDDDKRERDDNQYELHPCVHHLRLPGSTTPQLAGVPAGVTRDERVDCHLRLCRGAEGAVVPPSFRVGVACVRSSFSPLWLPTAGASK